MPSSMYIAMHSVCMIFKCNWGELWYCTNNWTKYIYQRQIIHHLKEGRILYDKDIATRLHGYKWCPYWQGIWSTLYSQLLSYLGIGATKQYILIQASMVGHLAVFLNVNLVSVYEQVIGMILTTTTLSVWPLCW